MKGRLRVNISINLFTAHTLAKQNTKIKNQKQKKQKTKNEEQGLTSYKKSAYAENSWCKSARKGFYF